MQVNDLRLLRRSPNYPVYKNFIYVPNRVKAQMSQPDSRTTFERAARDLRAQGLTPRDIGEALHLGTAAVIDLLEANRAA